MVVLNQDSALLNVDVGHQQQTVSVNGTEKIAQMKRKAPASPTLSPETDAGSGSAERKKHCLENGDGKLDDAKADDKTNTPENGHKSPECATANGNAAMKESPSCSGEMGFSAEKLRQILQMEETNLLLLKKLKASQQPKVPPPAPQATVSTAQQQTNSASHSINNVASNSASSQTASNVSSVSTPGVTNSNVANTPTISVNNVTTAGNLNSSSHQNLHVAVQQQQQLLQQIQQSNQIKAVVAAAAQQHLVAAAHNQRRATVIPSNTPVPSVSSNPQQVARNAQVQQNVAVKVTAPSVSTLPPNVVPNALFRGPPPSVTPGTTVTSSQQQRSQPSSQAQSQSQQPAVRSDPAAAAKREQAAKLALKKQLEKTLLQIPPPRPPPANLDFLVWPTIEFLYLIGLEETVEKVLVDSSMKPDSSQTATMAPPLQCAQCQSDFTTVWKRDDSGKVICEQCLVNNNKKAVKKEHTNRLKLAVENALQQEKEIIQKLKEEERKNAALAAQQAAARAQHQQQQQQQQQSSNVSAVVASMNAHQNVHSAAAGHSSHFHNPSPTTVTAAKPPLFINPSPSVGNVISSAAVSTGVTPLHSIHNNHQPAAPAAHVSSSSGGKARILNPAPISSRGPHGMPHGMRKY